MVFYESLYQINTTPIREQKTSYRRAPECVEHALLKVVQLFITLTAKDDLRVPEKRRMSFAVETDEEVFALGALLIYNLAVERRLAVLNDKKWINEWIYSSIMLENVQIKISSVRFEVKILH